MKKEYIPPLPSSNFRHVESCSNHHFTNLLSSLTQNCKHLRSQNSDCHDKEGGEREVRVWIFAEKKPRASSPEAWPSWTLGFVSRRHHLNRSFVSSISSEGSE
ncbi:hypothetical protein LINGRAHAP2_LOCUS31698 [Linum grandiflorum]